MVGDLSHNFEPAKRSTVFRYSNEAQWYVHYINVIVGIWNRRIWSNEFIMDIVWVILSIHFKWIGSMSQLWMCKYGISCGRLLFITDNFVFCSLIPKKNIWTKLQDNHFSGTCTSGRRSYGRRPAENGLQHTRIPIWAPFADIIRLRLGHNPTIFHMGCNYSSMS